MMATTTTKAEKIYVQFKDQALTVYEGDRVLSVTVTRSKVPSPAVAMSGEIHPASGSTAKKGRDYIYDTGKPVVFFWAATDTSLEKIVSIPIQENNLLQGDRILILHESKFVNCAKGGQNECRVTIKDGKNPNTPPPTVTHEIGGANGKTFDTFLDDIRATGIKAGDTARFNEAIEHKTVQNAIVTATAPLPIPDPTAEDNYSKLVLADNPLFYCKFGSVTKPIDLSTNSKTLEYIGKVISTVDDGYTINPVDGNAAIVLDELAPVPAICTIEFAFKASSGGLIYFGDGKIGSASFSLDFLLSGNSLASWIVATTGGKWSTMGANVADGNWHKLTIVSGATSFVVVLDEAVIYNDAALAPVNFNGYWHFGYSMIGKTLAGSIKNISVTLAEISTDRAIQRQSAMVL